MIGLKIMIMLLAVAMFAACATIEARFRLIPIHDGIDPDFGAYVDNFTQIAGKALDGKKRKLTIGYHKLPDDVVGTCFRFADGRREISFDKVKYNDLTPDQRRVATFHELDHCLCDRGHDHPKGKYTKKDLDETPNKLPDDPKTIGYYEDYCPTSLMHPRVLPEACIYRHWSEYVVEMLDRCDP